MASTKELHNLRLMLLGAVVCVLCLTASPASFAQSAFAGVYTGTFIGPRDNGQFAVLVRTNNVAIVMAFDAFDQLGFVNQNVTINPNGSFAKSNIDGAGTFASGTFIDTGVTGTFVDQNGFTGNFQGTKQPGNGFARDVGGFYVGGFSGTVTFDGSPVGTFSGDWFLLIAANGITFQVAKGTVSAQGQVERFEVGALDAVISVEALCQSVSLGSISITCTFNPSTFTFSGSFFIADAGITISGTFSLTRRVPLPDLPPVAVNDVIIDFGPGHGIWVRFNNSFWVQLTTLSADTMVTGDVDGS